MAAEVFQQVLREARSHGVSEIEAIIGSGEEALTRFANNAIHQNVAERTRHLSVRAVIEGRTARATTNRLDPDGIRGVVEQAIAIPRLTEPDPDLLPLLEPAAYQARDRYAASTAGATPEQRARAVAEAIRVVEGAGQTAAGILSTGVTTSGILNSRGVAAHYTES